MGNGMFREVGRKKRNTKMLSIKVTNRQEKAKIEVLVNEKLS